MKPTIKSIKWFGGKSKLVKTLLSFIPKYETYVEVFGGAGNLLFNLPKNNKTVYNDNNPTAVNFWKVIQDKQAFGELLDMLEFSLYARKFLEKEVNFILDHLPAKDLDVNHAWHFLIRMYTVTACLGGTIKPMRLGSYGSCYNSDVMPKKLVNLSSRLHKLHQLLEGVDIHNYDFTQCITGYDRSTAFFYCDPPYVVDGDTRADDPFSSYQKDFTMEDHCRLKQCLIQVKGKVLLSYNDTDFIRKLYKGWCMTSVSVPKGSKIMATGDKRKSIPEVIITNYGL